MNRKERRAAEAKARGARRDQQRDLIVAEATPEVKARMQAHCMTPAYKQLVRDLVLVARRWVELHPEARLEWNDLDRTLVDGHLGDDYVKGYIAASPDAFALLAFMDEMTGGRASLLQAYFALGHSRIIPSKE